MSNNSDQKNDNPKYPIITGAKLSGGYFSQYVAFVIKTPAGHEIKRRYSDFEWLRHMLCSYYPGAFIPPIPPKLAVAMWPDGYLQMRKRELQQFLKRLEALPYLKKEGVTIFFLTNHGKSINKSRAKYEKNHPKPSNQEIFQKLVGAFPQIHNTSSPLDMDKRCFESKILINESINKLEKMVNSTQQFIKNNSRCCNALTEFKNAFKDLIRIEYSGLNVNNLNYFSNNKRIDISLHLEQWELYKKEEINNMKVHYLPTLNRALNDLRVIKEIILTRERIQNKYKDAKKKANAWPDYNSSRSSDLAKKNRCLQKEKDLKNLKLLVEKLVLEQLNVVFCANATRWKQSSTLFASVHLIALEKVLGSWISLGNKVLTNKDKISIKQQQQTQNLDKVLDLAFTDNKPNDIEYDFIDDDQKQMDLLQNDNSQAQLVKVIQDQDEITAKVQQKLSKLKIQNKMSLKTPVDFTEKEYTFHDDRYDTNITPIGSDPVVSFHLDTPFNTWDINKQYSFLLDVANALNIKPSQLVPISVSSGSTILSAMICNVIDDKLPAIEKAVIEVCDNIDLPSKWKVKSSQLKNHLNSKKLGDNNDNNDNIPHNLPNNQNKQLSTAEKWFVSQAESLRDSIMISLQDCPDEYEISAIFILDNDKCLNEFIQQIGYKNSSILFHGTKLDNLDSILKGGFDDKFIGSATDPGWYGRGHYFTSYPQYSMPYCEPNQFGQHTLIVSYVNLGKTFQVYDNQTYNGKALESGYQSHYVKVTRSGGAVPKDQLNSYKGDIFDEYVVCTGSRVLPRFCVTFTKKSNVVVWRDKKITNAENSSILNKLKESYVVYGAETSDDALTVIAKKKGNNKVYIITNGADESENFIKSVRGHLGIQTPILVFTSSMQFEEQFKKYNAQTTTSGSTVHEFVKKYIQ